ncbi:Non-heme dioxygenase N-terminal domain-containing protein [Cynara cardunculus var. scolymus]|uniref:Non-heme dioxygenase N-terminal domain-containing protein n=1 Tax=Cynara cardunculus var. scolymus TaxID=59895 RepID=A0A118JU53_CYNCS|nr:Non-heme dioxygenase N-terminal domain-containing protein [Cynara cardunculus var. scolymus]
MAMDIGENTGEIINRSGYGGSIPVANVQALASEEMKDIPIRYVRPEIQSEEVLTDESLQVPVIDFSKLSVAGKPGYDDELAKLHVACRDWGFFQLINHGVLERIDAMKKVIEKFFKLPLEEKMKYAQIPGMLEGYGQAFVVSEDQKLDWGDMLFLVPLPVDQRNTRFWPQNPTSFRTTFHEYSNELNGVSKELLKFMSINLGMEPDAINKLYENCVQSIRMNYYPPCRVADKVLGLAPHSDATGITLLVQVNGVQGLQIKNNSKWVPIKPIPGSIIVNIGDIMEERLSIAAFHGPGLEVKIGPLPELVKEKTTKYKTIDGEDYLRLIISSKLDGKSLIERMKIQE